MRWLLRALGIVAVLALAGAAWVAWRLQDRPNLSRYARYEMSAAPPATRRPRVSVSFLGVATLLISDGETHLMTDGWFTRVGLGDFLLRRAVSPDTDAIARGLQRAGVTRLAAVMPVHSHYDHAQDAPDVARRTGAILLGSESTAWIGRGAGMREQQIRLVEPGVPTHFGKFTVTHILSKHVPLPGNAQKGPPLTAPLIPPATVRDYPMGGAWSILIEHPLGTALVQGSAGFVPDALKGRRADTVFLGTGALTRQCEEYQDAYLREILDAVDAHRVIPIHYDDLFAPVGDALVPSPALVDDVPAAFDRLLRWASEEEERSFALLPWWTPVVLFD